MDKALSDWHPTSEEVERILAEMRPIIQDFARQDPTAPQTPEAQTSEAQHSDAPAG